MIMMVMNITIIQEIEAENNIITMSISSAVPMMCMPFKETS